MDAKAIASLSSNPLRLVRGADNYALGPIGYRYADGAPTRRASPVLPAALEGGDVSDSLSRLRARYSATMRAAKKADRGGLYYRMACGHQSLPNLTVCQAGCLKAPVFEAPPLELARPGWKIAADWNARKGIPTDATFNEAFARAQRRLG